MTVENNIGGFWFLVFVKKIQNWFILVSKHFFLNFTSNCRCLFRGHHNEVVEPSDNLCIHEQ